MAFDLTQMIQAAAEAMSDGGHSAAQPVKEGAKKAKGGASAEDVAEEPDISEEPGQSTSKERSSATADRRR